MGGDVDCPLCGRTTGRAAKATLHDLSVHFVNECPAIKTESNRRRS